MTGACRDCGDLTGLESGLCRACRLFRWSHPVGTCPWCGRQQPVGASGECRSCQLAARAARRAALARRKQSRTPRPRVVLPPAVPAPAITGACRDCGDLTWLSGGLCKPCRAFRGRHPVGACAWCGRQQPVGAAGECRSCQLAGLAARKRAREAPRRRPPRPAARDTLDGYAEAHGWGPKTVRDVRRAVTTATASHGQLGEPPWDAAPLRQFLIRHKLVALRARSSSSPPTAWPGPSRRRSSAGGSRPASRRCPRPSRPRCAPGPRRCKAAGRAPGGPARTSTIQGYVRILEAPLASWAARYGSLRQVTTDDLTAELGPLTGATRLLALSAMRSLFGTLKARRVLFTNPAAPLTGRRVQPPPVLPLDDGLRASLLGRLHGPAERLIVLLAGVHALRPADICALTLEDANPAAGTLVVSGRARPLDRLTARQLRAWLHARHARWPATANPHLLINLSTAGGLKPVNRGFIHAAVRQLGITAQDLRADRLHDEAQASGGDPLRLAHLFGLSDGAAIRYCAEISRIDDTELPPA